MLQELNALAKNYEYLIKAVGAFLPFLIAIFMAYVAYQQWQTNKNKHNQDIFNAKAEHVQNLFIKWQTINNYISDFGKEVFITSGNGDSEVITATIIRTRDELKIHNILTVVLFNSNMQELENNFINALNKISIVEGIIWQKVDITKEYKECKTTFDIVYNEYIKELMRVKNAN